MKMLITGGAGFIGANFVRYAIRNNIADSYVILDALTYAGNLSSLDGCIDDEICRFVQGDIADEQFVASLFETEHFDTVVHFAAESHVDKSIIAPDDFVRTNVVGTHVLLKNALRFNLKRFHHISTDEVFGDLGDSVGTYFSEKTPYDPTSPYASSKACSDLLVRSYFRTYGLPITISNCSNNYGPYQYPEKLIPYVFKLASQNKNVPVYGDGLNIRDWLYVEDHCEAIATILRSGRIGETYCIGGNNEVKNLDLVKMILTYLGKSESLITFVEDRKSHDRRYAIDPSKIKNEIGWTPKMNLDQGLKKTLEWYESNELWWKDLEAKHNRM